MSIETIIVILIALILPLLTEWRLRRMLKKTLNSPETPKQVAKLFREVLEEWMSSPEMTKTILKIMLFTRALKESDVSVRLKKTSGKGD